MPTTMVIGAGHNDHSKRTPVLYWQLRRPRPSRSASGVGHRVECHGDGQDQHVVLQARSPRRRCPPPGPFLETSAILSGPSPMVYS